MCAHYNLLVYNAIQNVERYYTSKQALKVTIAKYVCSHSLMFGDGLRQVAVLERFVMGDHHGIYRVPLNDV